METDGDGPLSAIASWSPCYHDKEPTSLCLHPPGAASGGEWMGGGRAIGNFNRQCIGPASLSLARPAADRAWILGMGGGRDDALPQQGSIPWGRGAETGEDGSIRRRGEDGDCCGDEDGDMVGLDDDAIPRRVRERRG